MPNKDNTPLYVVISSVLLVILSFLLLGPEIKGDSVSYVEAMSFLSGNGEPSAFILNRIITTSGALWTIIFFTKIFAAEAGVWLAVNTILYILSALSIYKILILLFDNKKTALFGALFFMGNYAILRFGLNFLMDMGGWAFYIFSIYFILKYAKFGNRKHILLASGLIGIGGLFKEYAFLAVIPVACLLIYENRKSILGLVKKAILPAFLACAPIVLVYAYAYMKYRYTWLDWLQSNQLTYVYQSRMAEYVKSVGSLLNVLAVLFLGGLWVLKDSFGALDQKVKVFLIGIFASVLPIFAWPAITQRTLFILVPFVVIISSFFVDKYKHRYYLFIPVLLAYILAGFLMDSFLLNAVELPF